MKGIKYRLRFTLLSLLSEYPSYTDSDNKKRSDDKHLSYAPILFMTNLLYLYIKIVTTQVAGNYSRND